MVENRCDVRVFDILPNHVYWDGNDSVSLVSVVNSDRQFVDYQIFTRDKNIKNESNKTHRMEINKFAESILYDITDPKILTEVVSMIKAKDYVASRNELEFLEMIGLEFSRFDKTTGNIAHARYHDGHEFFSRDQYHDVCKSLEGKGLIKILGQEPIGFKFALTGYGAAVINNINGIDINTKIVSDIGKQNVEAETAPAM